MTLPGFGVTPAPGKAMRLPASAVAGREAGVTKSRKTEVENIIVNLDE
jgi:hypothetical protein